MKTRKVTFVCLAVVLLMFVASVAPYRLMLPPWKRIDESEISHCVCKYFDPQNQSILVTERNIPSEQIGKLLALLDNSEVQEDYTSWRVWGNIDVVDTRGNVVLRIVVYLAGHDRGAFECNGTTYTGPPNEAWLRLFSEGEFVKTVQR